MQQVLMLKHFLHVLREADYGPVYVRVTCRKRLCNSHFISEK